MLNTKKQPKQSNDPHLYVAQPIPVVFLTCPDTIRRKKLLIAGITALVPLIGLSVTVLVPKSSGIKISASTQAIKQVEPFDIKLTLPEPPPEYVAEATKNSFSPQESVSPKTAFSMEVTFEAAPQQENTQGDAVGQAQLAQQALRQGKLKEALLFQHRAAELAPENTFYRLDLAILYDRLGDTQSASVLYQQVILAYEAHDPKLSSVNIKEIQQRMDYLLGKNRL